MYIGTLSLITTDIETQSSINFSAMDRSPDHRSVKIISAWVLGIDDRMRLFIVEKVFRSDINRPTAEIFRDLGIHDRIGLKIGFPQGIYGIRCRHSSTSVKLSGEVELPFLQRSLIRDSQQAFVVANQRLFQPADDAFRIPVIRFRIRIAICGCQGKNSHPGCRN